MDSSSGKEVLPHQCYTEIFLGGVWLTCAVAVLLPATMRWGNQHAGETGVEASLAAAGLCWAASLVALLVRTRFAKPQEAIVGTLGAMLVRLVLIFGGSLLVSAIFPQFVKSAFWGQVVVYFLLTLTIETLLAVRWVKKLERFALVNDSGEEPSLPNRGAKAV